LSGDAPRAVLGADGIATQVWASASSGSGLPGLREALAHAVRPNQIRRTLHLELQAAAVRSDLYKRNAVRLERQCEDGSWDLEVELDSSELAKLLGVKGVRALPAERSLQQRVA
jgi:50S ribosomal subunit-associated GTPase HflX